jgi:hypothetical protein
VRPYDLCAALNLAPGYYRGLAYLQSGLPERAIAEKAGPMPIDSETPVAMPSGRARSLFPYPVLQAKPLDPRKLSRVVGDERHVEGQCM